MNYRLQERKFSSNIIEKRIVTEEGKERWIPFVAPLVKKTDGDVVCNEILEFLNNKE
ncbi:MAG: hypothetical protein PQJ49_01440 [Sphaerochaetaceae bacterium]|nr:hypothetical protein [Sphaerochaetaceae bacterium]